MLCCNVLLITLPSTITGLILLSHIQLGMSTQSGLIATKDDMIALMLPSTAVEFMLLTSPVLSLHPFSIASQYGALNDIRIILFSSR